jgi:hypothetical protein
MRLYCRDTSSVADAALTFADTLNHVILMALARPMISLDEQPVLIVWPLVASIIFGTQMAMGTRGQSLREALRAKLYQARFGPGFAPRRFCGPMTIPHTISV